MKTRLSWKQKLLVAGTLFGMFFGAGNLIFPVHLGQIAGRNAAVAIAGFVITAVGIPILGVAAIGNTHSGGLQDLANKVGRGYGYFFTAALYLTIGPFFAIPRCATTSFTTGIAPMIGGMSEGLALLVFSGVFFALVLLFSLRPGKITVWIGKIINPLFLIFLTVLVVSALKNPGASLLDINPEPAYENGVFFSALIEGYGTMDAIAGLAFGIVVIDIVRSMGVTDDSNIAKDVLSSGILTGILMGGIYIATIIMGAQSRGLFETSENGGIALAQIAGHYLGGAGSIVLALTITFACLKTSIGLVTSCSEAFVAMFPKGPGYRVWAVGFTVFSFVVSNFGLSNILNYSLPVLMLLYPLAITLILLALTGQHFVHDRKVYVCVTACTLFAAIFDMLKTLPAGMQIPGLEAFGRKILPWFDLNLGWVVPALVGLAIGLLLRRKKSAG
ncbi:MAG: branched-chain amino acid transport system II carrier protein [Oscillospiraceae bacterium]|nr:branched-chain amino acid transport system II carrier protein [Oscillospiraceae bacterium]